LHEGGKGKKGMEENRRGWAILELCPSTLAVVLTEEEKKRRKSEGEQETRSREKKGWGT